MDERETGPLPAALLPEVAGLLSGWVAVASDSMAPWLLAGDEVRLVLARPQLGEIVLVPYGDHLLLHRLLRRDGSGLWLGGDASGSWEGPLPDQDWPVVRARRRRGREAPGDGGWGLAWLAPWLVRLNLPGGRRVLAGLLRRMAAVRRVGQGKTE